MQEKLRASALLVAVALLTVAPASAQDEAVDEPTEGDAGAPTEGGAGGAVPIEREEDVLQLSDEVQRAEEVPATEGADDVPLDVEGGAVPAPAAPPPEGPPPADAPAEPAPSPEWLSAAPAPVDPLDPCVTDLRGRPIGPLQVGALDGNLGVPRRACPRQELAIGGDVLLVAHADELYGNIRVNGRGRISAPIMDPRVEGFVEWEGIRYQTVLRSVAAAYLGLGYLSWGASGQVVREPGFVLAVAGRMVLPTTTGLDQRSQPFALDLGVNAAFRVDRGVRFHAWLNLIGSVRAGGPPGPRGGVRLGVGVDLRATEWLSFVLEVASGFGYVEALDLLAAQGGVRLGFSDEVGLELGVSFPFVGARAFDDGALPIAATLMLAWHMR